MMPLSTVLAVILLTAPPDAPSDNPGVSLPVLQSVAVSLELMDPRECRWTFASLEGNAFSVDLRLIRTRWEELCDAPPLCDIVRWPDTETITATKHFNRDYRAWLEERQRLFPGEEWIAEAIGECDMLYAAWDLASDARSDWYYVAGKRKALVQLRERIGAWNYYSGTMPPAVPVWRMRRVD